MSAFFGNIIVAIFGFSGVGLVLFLVIMGIVIVCKSISSK